MSVGFNSAENPQRSDLIRTDSGELEWVLMEYY